MGGMSPAEVASGNYGFIDWQQLITRISRIMSDDGLGRIGRPDQFTDDTVGINRNLIGSEFWLPALFPRCAHARQVFMHALLLVRIRWPLRADFFDELFENQSGIAENRNIGLVVFVEIAWIDCRMDDLFTGWQVRCKDRLGEASANGEHCVTMLQVVTDHICARVGSGTQ